MANDLLAVMVHRDELVLQRNIRGFKVGQCGDDVVNPHVLPAVSLLVDDEQSGVMSADAQAEFMKRSEVLRVPRQHRQALSGRIQKVRRVMIARATQRSRRYQPVGTRSP